MREWKMALFRGPLGIFLHKSLMVNIHGYCYFEMGRVQIIYASAVTTSGILCTHVASLMKERYIKKKRKCTVCSPDYFWGLSRMAPNSQMCTRMRGDLIETKFLWGLKGGQFKFPLMGCQEIGAQTRSAFFIKGMRNFYNCFHKRLVDA